MLTVLTSQHRCMLLPLRTKVQLAVGEPRRLVQERPAQEYLGLQ